MTVLHVCLNVADAEESAQWYVEELGFERSWEFTSTDGNTRNVYVTDESGIELQLADTTGETPTTQGDMIDHIAIEVPDVETAIAAIDHHGVLLPPQDHPTGGGQFAFIADPDGHRVELIEPLGNA